MKILLVEDQKDKQHKLVSFLEFEIGPNAEVFVEESLRGGLKYLLLNSDSISNYSRYEHAKLWPRRSFGG